MEKATIVTVEEWWRPNAARSEISFARTSTELRLLRVILYDAEGNVTLNTDDWLADKWGRPLPPG